MVKNSLTKMRPDLVKEWDHEKNKLKPDEVSCGSGKVVWWKCRKSNHEWEARIGHRNNGSSCPYCSGQKVCNDNCLAALRPDLAEEWDYDKNILTPKDITCNSGRKFWWKCKNKHRWEATVANRNYNNRGCPYCSGQKVCNDNCLATLRPGLIEEWDYDKNGKTPYDFTHNSGKKIWWKCKNKHEWETTIAHRSAGEGCPYCSGNRVCKDNCLATLRPDLAEEWDYDKNEKTPYDFTCGSNKKVWWVCSKNNKHKWKTIISDRNRGCGCPYCIETVSKPSQIWLDFLGILRIYGKYRERWIKIGKRRFKVDGFDPIRKIVYEFNGDFWHGNPLMYDPCDMNPVCKKTYGELYGKMLEKKEILEGAGYKVVSIWESEFRNYSLF